MIEPLTTGQICAIVIFGGLLVVALEEKFERKFKN